MGLEVMCIHSSVQRNGLAYYCHFLNSQFSFMMPCHHFMPMHVYLFSVRETSLMGNYLADYILSEPQDKHYIALLLFIPVC